jgi:hypothetical protein
MVLMNAGKRSRYTDSIVHQNQGGGDKKAGLPPTMRMTSAKWIGYKNRGLPRSMAVMKLPLVSTVRQSRPIQVRPENWN